MVSERYFDSSYKIEPRRFHWSHETECESDTFDNVEEKQNNLSGNLSHFRSRYKLHLLLHIGHHISQDLVGSSVGMGNPDGSAVFFCNSNKFYKLLFNKCIVLEMVDKDIPLSKR